MVEDVCGVQEWLALQDTPVIILLAAGHSSRMGRWKPGIPFRGEPLIKRVLGRVLSLGYPTLLVGGNRYKELMELVEQFREVLAPQRQNLLRVVYNEHFSKGFISSVQRGLEEVKGKDFFILPADMPEIPAEVWSQLEKAIGGADMARPEYKGSPGHPVLCRHWVKDTIMKLPAGDSLRRGLSSLEAVAIPSSQGCIVDVDTPEDCPR